MAAQLDILALEPYFGGRRRSMLHTLIRCSRHRWNLLKLPPRRMERRLRTAARWFAERVTRTEFGRIDFLFVGEAMNLAEFQRLVPHLAGKPSVVYFHENQLPDFEDGGGDESLRQAQGEPLPQAQDGPLDLVNLNSAMAASEIWFNSHYHREVFEMRVRALIGRHPELTNRDPSALLAEKSHVVPPPVDMSLSHELDTAGRIFPNVRILFIDSRGASTLAMGQALAHLRLRGERFEIRCLGPDTFCPPNVPLVNLHERDEMGIVRALHESGVYLNVQTGVFSDENAVRALMRKGWPVVSDNCVYSELLPASLHHTCLHDGTPDSITYRLLDAWYRERPAESEHDQADLLEPYDSVYASKVIDDRISQLAGRSAVRA